MQNIHSTVKIQIKFSKMKRGLLAFVLSKYSSASKCHVVHHTYKQL